MPIQSTPAPRPAVPEPTTTGGNTTLRNGDEGAAPRGAAQSTPVRRSADLDDDFSHVQGPFRQPGL